MQTKTLISTIGKNLVETLSQTLVKDHYAAIIELVCNSYDEDAENVNITYDSLTDRLIIEDDGIGMDKDGIDNFYRLGDSTKVENPFSPGKRRRIGKFGIATVLIEYLGGSYDLETWKDGNKITISEKFRETESKGNIFKSEEYDKHGTRITIRDLHLNKDNFSAKRLLERLQWDIPAVPDFNVYVNKQYVRKRSVIEHSAEYLVEEDIDGHILEGIIHIQHMKTKEKLPGILIYVDKRKVGDPDEFKLIDIDERLEGSTLGIINADFLRNSITLDRSRIQDTPEFTATKEAILKILKSIDSDLDYGKPRTAYYMQDNDYLFIKRVLNNSENLLNQKLHNNDSSVYYHLKLNFNEKSGPIARLDSKENTIYINAENPMLGFVHHQKEKLLQKMFLTLSAHALANNKIREKLDSIEDLDTLIFEEAENLFEGKKVGDIIRKHHDEYTVVPITKIYFNRYRLYTTIEITDLSGRNRNTIRYLITSGALKEKIPERYMRKEIVPILKKIEGYKSAISIADKKYSKKRIFLDNPEPSFIDKELGKYESEFPELMDVGVNFPFYFIPNDKVKQFKSFLEKKELVR